jgi:hypothetical protein
MAAPFLLGEWDVENVPQGLKPSVLAGFIAALEALRHPKNLENTTSWRT